MSVTRPEPLVPPYRAPLGGDRDQIDTPALLLDRDKLEHNIAAMAAFAAGGPAKLRPHSKTHKCVEIARLQLAAGATGITCAKVGEAEALAEGGISDILIANQVVGPIKIARLVELARRCTVTIAVDDAGNVVQLAAAAAQAGVVVRCYVEVDVGMARCGVPDGAAALALARLVSAEPGLVFAGLQTYEGHLQNVVPLTERVARAEHDMAGARAAKEAVEAGGLAVGEVSGGGTGTHMVTGRLPWMTELQCGSYATMDAQYRAVGGADFDNALTVLTTVISRPRPDRAVIDAGLKGVTPEFGEPTVLVEGASWLDFSEEHGELALTGAAQRLRIGDKIELVPRHGCTTVNLYDQFHVLRDGRLVDVWRVAGRGRSQ
ncbi:MAG TPA: DSD1 family PLP-dependent enzyme [Thermoleophilia bacterium]|nr:DSD1 family PLP-dependent enzyme [Thermoleophilia bacterium]